MDMAVTGDAGGELLYVECNANADEDPSAWDPCPYCSGEACALCGPYLSTDVLLGHRPPCEHDVVERHTYRLS